MDNKKHILNMVFSAEEKHHSVLNIHTDISQILSTNEYRVTNLFLSGEPAKLPVFPDNNKYWKLNTRLVRKKGVLNKLKYQLLKYRLLQLIKKNNIDLVICDGITSIALLCSIQIYSFIKAVGIFHSPAKIKKQQKNLIKQHINLWHFVAVSEMVRDELLASNCGITMQNSCIIHNAIDLCTLKKSSFSKDEAREKLGINKGKFVFGITGRLVTYKNHSVIIEAVQLLKVSKQWPEDAQVVIIGDGNKKEFLKEKVNTAGLQNDFLFTGWISNASYYIAAFDAFIMASTNKEGFGVALLEGCSLKIPVIASDTDIFRTITGNNAFYFPVGDHAALAKQILSVISLNKTKRREKGQVIYDHIQRYFDIEKFKLSYLALSDKILR